MAYVPPPFCLRGGFLSYGSAARDRRIISR